MRSAITALSLAIAGCAALRQPRTVDASHGAVFGVVRDPAGNPLAQALVRAIALQGPDSGRIVTAVSTLESGEFLLRRVRAGTYNLQFLLICRSVITRRHNIRPDKVDTLRVTLSPVPLSECIPE